MPLKACRPLLRAKLSGIEALEDRRLLAITATFSASTGTLSVVGDETDNVIEISRSIGGQIFVNSGQVAISGGAPTVANTTRIFAFGLDGNDQISLNEVNGAMPESIMLGGSGDDLLVGGSNADTLIGASGNDTLRGQDSDDRLFGGTDNDVLLGDAGNDQVNGDDGDDLMVVNNGDGSDRLEGGEGNDFVQVNGSNSAGDDFSVDPNGDRVRFQRNNLGLFTVDIGTTENLDVNGQGGSDIISGSVGLSDLIALDLDGGEGNDLIIGGDGIDVLRGGAGNDTLLGKRANDIVLGEAGDDLMIVNHGDGSDLLEGGTNRDTVQVNGSDAAGDDFSINPNGQRVRFQRNNLGLFQLDIGTTENLDVNGQGGDDVIAGTPGLDGFIALDIDGGEGNDLLIGSDGDDVIRGGAGNDSLLGKGGNDIVLGEEGDDLMIVDHGDGSDFLEGGADVDTVQVNGSDAAGDDFSIDPNGQRIRFQRNNLGLFQLDIGTTEQLDVNAQGGDDAIIAATGLDGIVALDMDGGEGNDLIIGSDGVDVLRGGPGNDTLLGKRGDDVVLGQQGDDLAVHNEGDGDDLFEGGSGDDTQQVNGSNLAGDAFAIRPNGLRVLFERTFGSLFQIDIGTTESLDVNGQGGDDLIAAQPGLAGLIALDLDGGEGQDFLFGGDGDDVLRGGAGNDTINGRGGDDIVLGEAGNDLLIANVGEGTDLLEGGTDNDTVQIHGSENADHIAISNNGVRTTVQRTNQTPSALDAGTTEDIVVDLRGGDDHVNVSALANLDHLRMLGGDGSDRFQVAPSATTTIEIEGDVPNASPGDTIVVATTNPFTDTGATIQAVGMQPIHYLGIEHVTTGLDGDFNQDGVVDADDIDLLFAAVDGGDNTFDLNADGRIDHDDVRILVEDILDTSFGDANLDGVVDALDFIVWNDHKFGPDAGWASGDFNGDGVIDGIDFTIWNDNKFV